MENYTFLTVNLTALDHFRVLLLVKIIWVNFGKIEKSKMAAVQEHDSILIHIVDFKEKRFRRAIWPKNFGAITLIF